MKLQFTEFIISMSGIDVFVGNYPVIDWDLYRLWVEGKFPNFLNLCHFLFLHRIYRERSTLSSEGQDPKWKWIYRQCPI